MDKHSTEFHHISVLLRECIGGLRIKPEGVYVDGTAGGAGHSVAIARELSTGKLIAIDKDADAVKTAAQRLAAYPCAQVVQGDFMALDEILRELGIGGVDGILLDLGVSSHQMDKPERGFSYRNDAPLDMRMNRVGPSARDIVNTYTAEALSKILFGYGEEKFARRIAQAIVKRREVSPIETTLDLAEIVKSAIPAASRREGGHPAKRTFQAIRIEVNDELSALERCLHSGFGLLKSGGRFVVITFHSLEDRMVKQAFAGYARGCVCPPDFPICTCGKTPLARLVNRKPITAEAEELDSNNRSRSAKLRILEKL